MNRTQAIGHAPRTREMSKQLSIVSGCIGCDGCTGLCPALIELLGLPDAVLTPRG